MTSSPRTNSRLAVLLFALLAACKPAPPTRGKPPAVPRARATVVTIRTTTMPANTRREHLIVIVGNRVRSTEETDVWRLLDPAARTVTFVDDIGRTMRTESMDEIVRRRKLATAGPLPGHYQNARLARPEETRTLLGITASLLRIEAGAYRRDLWLAEHPEIPSGLFAMMHASEAPSSPLEPMMREAGAAILAADGFPLSDRAEVPYGDHKLIVERTVISVSTREVAESLVTIPKGYVDLSGKK